MDTPSWFWSLVCFGAFCGLINWLATPAQPDINDKLYPKPKPRTPQQRAYERRWADYLAHERKLEQDKLDNPLRKIDMPSAETPTLTMSAFASKEDYEAWLAMRKGLTVIEHFDNQPTRPLKELH